MLMKPLDISWAWTYPTSRSVSPPGSGSGGTSCAGGGWTRHSPEGERSFGAGGSQKQEDLQRHAERRLLVRPQQRSQADRRTVWGLSDVAHVWHGRLATGDKPDVSRFRKSVNQQVFYFLKVNFDFIFIVFFIESLCFYYFVTFVTVNKTFNPIFDV